MPRHSKNNTSSAQFTYAERTKARRSWGGTATAELGSTAQRPWNSCVLCLAPARRPTVDAAGHLFCRECVLSDLVAQKDEIARIQNACQALADRREQREKASLQRAHDRRVQEFEARQNVTATAGPLSRKRKADDDPESLASSGPNKNGLAGGDHAAEVADEELRRIHSDLAAEEAEAKKSRLPSFWLPSLTPSEQQDALKLGLWSTDGVPSKPNCRAGKPHPLNVKQLVDLRFWRPGNSQEEETPVDSACPTCQTMFGQTTQACVLRQCGHVLCRRCCLTLVLQPAGYAGTIEDLHSRKNEKTRRVKAQCAHCDADVRDAARDIVPLQREGTGYAAAGNKTVVKKGIAFQG